MFQLVIWGWCEGFSELVSHATCLCEVKLLYLWEQPLTFQPHLLGIFAILIPEIP